MLNSKNKFVLHFSAEENGIGKNNIVEKAGISSATALFLLGRRYLVVEVVRKISTAII